MNEDYPRELVAVDQLRPHPRNYRDHPDDQLEHIIASIEANGFYRNVVIARDGTILAGHGVVMAAKKMGTAHIPVVRLDVAPNEPRALKVLTGDNEISKLGLIDDRALTGMLKEIKDIEDNLLGTGFDDRMLAALVMVTRPADEIEDFDAAAEWIGMPEHDPGKQMFVLKLNFRSDQDRDAFLQHARIKKPASFSGGMVLSTWWPQEEQDDLISTQFTENNET